MRTRDRLRAFCLSTCIFCLSGFVEAEIGHAQSLPLDSLIPRLIVELRSPGLDSTTITHDLREAIVHYDDQRVWGMSAGDFNNDTLPDLALSLHLSGDIKNEVQILFFRNEGGRSLVPIWQRTVPYVESPMEVGLSTDGSVVTLIQKTGDQHWYQEGYSDEFGDLALVDRFETERQEIKEPKAKVRSLGHDIYRNFETLLTRESYFSASTGDIMFQTKYLTIPSYNRLRDIYPGYGHALNDTAKAFIIDGLGLRKDWRDLSIEKLVSAYDDDYIYISITVNDDYIINGRPKADENDRVTFWFDTKFSGDRMNRDRHILTKKGGFPVFRDATDSFLYSLTFALPANTGKVVQIDYSSTAELTPMQRESIGSVKAQYLHDTAGGLVTGYTLKARIPFTFLGFESNPAKLYENVPLPFVRDTARESSGQDQPSDRPEAEAATLGFTTLVTDVDDLRHISEETVQATSLFRSGDPSSFGTMILEPAGAYYGQVVPTYVMSLRERLREAGF